jgi:hypothetical protein
MFNFSFRIISMQDRGLIPNYEASVSKLFNSEMHQKIGPHVRPDARGARAGLRGRCAAHDLLRLQRDSAQRHRDARPRPPPRVVNESRSKPDTYRSDPAPDTVRGRGAHGRKRSGPRSERAAGAAQERRSRVPGERVPGDPRPGNGRGREGLLARPLAEDGGAGLAGPPHPGGARRRRLRLPGHVRPAGGVRPRPGAGPVHVHRPRRRGAAHGGRLGRPEGGVPPEDRLG